jgi:acetyl esterase
MTLDEATAAFLSDVSSSGVPPLHEMTVEDARALGVQLRSLYGDGPDMERVEQHVIDARDGGSFDLRVLVPHGLVRGIVVFYHGGGWTLGEIDDFDTLGRLIADRSHCSVVLVGFRLAPEHRYPTAVEDAWTALLWVAARRTEVAGGDVPLIVVGDSSGGNLAAVVSRRARDEGEPGLALQVLVYPVLDSDLETDSYRAEENQLLVTRQSMMWFWDHYAPDAAVRIADDASPLRGEDLSGLPATVIVAAEHDVLRDEGEAYADRLRAAAVDVDYRCFEGQMHGFFTLVNVLPGHREGLEYIVEAIERRLDS